MPWFGGKAVFRLSIVRRDGEGSSDATIVEERVLILNADDADGAIQRLEMLAGDYVNQGSWLNADGQQVRTRRLAAVDVYRISNDIADGAEIYSRTEIVQANVSDGEMVDRFFGSPASNDDDVVRGRFEPDFSRMVKGSNGPNGTDVR